VTASGKTAQSIRLAVRLQDRGVPVAIISADSRQVYRGLDIGTAKATAAERAGIPHHGLDLVDPDRPFSVADFVDHAEAALDDVARRGGLAILVGGTGLYLRAIARGLDTRALPSDPDVRAEVERELVTDGLASVADRLSRLAPNLGARTDLANPRRVARAMEIALLRGDAPLPAARGYPARSAWVGLRSEPGQHAARIARRARDQFDAGLVDEARGLREHYDPGLPAFSAIGYREAWAHLDGELTREEAIDRDAARNVQFARRQATWFRSEPGIRWLPADATAGEVALEMALRLMEPAALGAAR
jgi:tRNA dimethylallyltransferase